MSNTSVIHHYINGEKISGTGRQFEIYNPASGEVSKTVNLATAEETSRAIQAAKKAFPSWSATPPAKRARIMMKFMDLILQNMDELAEIVSSEHGKTLEDAKGSITRGLEVVEFCTGIPSHLKSDFTANVASEIDSYNVRQPLGVCAGITPFNFPAMVPMWMFPVSIACGNTFVLKPSEKDPSCSIRLAELMVEAGLPPGVLNVVVGDKESVDTILTHPDVEAVSFVGSTKIGEYIYHTGSAHNKRVQALCGAKNHLVAMPDADVEKTVNALMGAAYGSAGERCMAISVLVAVGDKIADRLIEELIPRVQSLKVGSYESKESEMGPVISKEALDKIRGYVNDGEKQGAKLLVDGRNIEVSGYPKGYFIGGCLFDEVTPEMSIYKEEIFGPVLSIVRVPSYEEALRLVNEHEYGNGAAIFTSDGDAARHFSMNALIGMIGVNVPIPVPVAYHSFGGWKRSIFGGFAIHGPEGVRFNTKLKTITTRWPSGIRDETQFNFKSGSES